MSFVEVRDISKIYQSGMREVTALKGMSFTLDKGDLAVIVGPSGSGKTTLLNMLGGMDHISSGVLRVNAIDLSTASSAELTEFRRFDVGFVFQFYNLIPNLTALENVELAAQICPDSMDAHEALSCVSMQHRASNFPSQLSGGEQQRVAIARALAKRPALLLCDEPTGALDYKTGKLVLSQLQNVCRELGTTVVIVTHNTAFTQLGTVVIHVKEGHATEVVRQDNPRDAQEIEW